MVLRTAAFAMGTRFELVLARDDARALAAAEEALATIEELDARLSRFRPDSLLSRINREAGAAWVRVDPETFALLARCQDWRAATGGAFDVCLGRPMDLVRAGRAESSEDLRAGAYALDAASSSVRFTRAGTQLDLGGIAKGRALDRAAQALREAGIDCALLHGGTSSVLGLGAPPTAPDGWRIALGAELGDATVVLRDAALSVSAARHADGAAHVLDARAARLVAAGKAAVTARSAEVAEVASTALLVGAGIGDLPGITSARTSLPVPSPAGA